MTSSDNLQAPFNKGDGDHYRLWPMSDRVGAGNQCSCNHANEALELRQEVSFLKWRLEAAHVVTEAMTKLVDAQHEELKKRPREEAIVSIAVIDVLAERKRQVEVLGWSEKHDDHHTGGELAAAGAAYATYTHWVKPAECPGIWPWGQDAWNPKDDRTNLIRAAALIIAEIERLDRASKIRS